MIVKGMKSKLCQHLGNEQNDNQRDAPITIFREVELSSILISTYVYLVLDH